MVILNNTVNSLTEFNHFFISIFQWDATDTMHILWAKLITVAAIFLFAWGCNKVVRYFLIHVVTPIIKKTKIQWDDILLHHGVLTHLSKLVAPIIIYTLTPAALPDGDFWFAVLERLSLVYITISFTRMINSVFTAIYDMFSDKQEYKGRPLKGLLQTSQVILIIIAGILCISIIMNESPKTLLTTLGASAAIILLIFKDSIMGFVAGIQLAANDMVKVGDWICMPKYNVDGNIIEVSLNTVKVQNWDNTIVTVPPYALVSDSMQNWKGMTESGGRRIKRSVYIDQNSVAFLNKEDIEAFKKIQILRPYIEEEEAELLEYNKKMGIDDSVLVNGRRQTNLGIFRAYLKQYLLNLPVVNQELTCMVRQLPPSPKGVPLELYFFSTIKSWVAYEGVQADVFDHVLAVVPHFGLRVFQEPTGQEIQQAISSISKN